VAQRWASLEISFSLRFYAYFLRNRGAIAENQRIIDPKKGPINKKAAVGNLPRIKSPKRPTSGAPEIVVTDTTNGRRPEPQISIKSINVEEKVNTGPLKIHSSKNFENSPPPQATSAGFTFDEDSVNPVTEVRSPKWNESEFDSQNSQREI